MPFRISVARIYPKVVIFLCALFLISCKTEKEVFEPPHTLLPAIEASLDSLIPIWYPRTIDSVNGGFWSGFNYQWQREGEPNKMVVTQARHLWTTATLAHFYGSEEYRKIAQHGYHFLRDVMWDKQYGGFHTLLRIEHDSLSVRSHTKSAYGNSFAIYGLTAYYKISKDTMALNLAKKTFLWLEEHAHDKQHKGYFDVIRPDGSLIPDAEENEVGYNNFIRRRWKDQNSSIHLLESFTTLYEAWPHPLLKERLEELLVLIRDTITTSKGYLNLHMEQDWTPISLRDSTQTYREQNHWIDHVSFGHDVETAFLMLEACHILGRKNDSLTLHKAKKMVDHALEWGWDKKLGGFYYTGYYWDNAGTRTIEDDSKVWWTQAEGLNSLLLFSKLFPEEPIYAQLFEKQWEYIVTQMIDHRYGGWLHAGLDNDPMAKYDPKAHNWKVNYHNVRALVNTIHMLKGTFPLTLDESEHLAPLSK